VRLSVGNPEGETILMGDGTTAALVCNARARAILMIGRRPRVALTSARSLSGTAGDTGTAFNVNQAHRHDRRPDGAEDTGKEGQHERRLAPRL